MARMQERIDEVKCSFCGKPQKQVRKLIAGPGVYICDECIGLCNEILMEDNAQFSSAPQPHDGLPRPSEIVQFLDKYVIGQDAAKRALAVAVYNHYKRIEAENSSYPGSIDVELSKSNILMLGPTGSGKTYLAQTLARKLKVPFAMADATALTEAGYVGDDVETILAKLLQAADWDVDKAQRGIIYIDEIDKITRKSDSPSLTRDVSGEGVQQGLLKILEGTVASVAPAGRRKMANQDIIQIDTRNILFICAGAFAGLEKVIATRRGKKGVGFGAEVNSVKDAEKDAFAYVQPEDLVKFGLIPEFIGRLPVVATVGELDRDTLVEVLVTPRNSLVKQYERLFEMDGVKLSFAPAALDAVADLAIERGTGARGLRAILEEILNPLMFTIPDDAEIDEVIITPECVSGKAEAELVRVPRAKAA